MNINTFIYVLTAIAVVLSLISIGIMIYDMARCTHLKSCKKLSEPRMQGLFLTETNTYEVDVECMKCGKKFTHTYSVTTD
jgi:hypothetical protein